MYKELEALLFNCEHAHRHGRDRFGIGGNDLTGGLKMRGIGAANLRAQVGLFCEWFSLLVVHHWLGKPGAASIARAIKARSEHVKNWITHGTKRLAVLLAERVGARLNRPYGKNGATPFVPRGTAASRKPKPKRQRKRR